MQLISSGKIKHGIHAKLWSTSQSTLIYPSLLSRRMHEKNKYFEGLGILQYHFQVNE